MLCGWLVVTRNPCMGRGAALAAQGRRPRPRQTASTLSEAAANKPACRSNSWGPRFARNVTFKVAYGAAGVLSLGDTYGVMWLPDDPTDLSIAASPLRTQPSSKAGCVIYTMGEAGSEL